IGIANRMTVAEKPLVIGGVPVVLRDCKKNSDLYEVRLSVTPDATNNWIRLQQAMQGKLQWLDAAGHPLDRRGSGSRPAGGDIEITASFARGQRGDGNQVGEPTKLVWDVPTETRDLTVPIEFKDLDMRLFGE